MQLSKTARTDIARMLADREQPLTVELVKRRFVAAGLAAPHERKAQAILDALPYGATATGDSALAVLDLCITNQHNGAVGRLLQLQRDVDAAGQARQKRRPARKKR